MLYVIKLGFEMINAKFFRIVDGNALSLALYPIPSFLFLILLLLLLFKSIEVNKVFHIFLFFFVKNEVFSVECGLIVIDLTPRDGKSNTTSTIRALMELPPHTLGAVVTP